MGKSFVAIHAEYSDRFFSTVKQSFQRDPGDPKFSRARVVKILRRLAESSLDLATDIEAKKCPEMDKHLKEDE